jgi:hypothetical protein
MLRAISYDMGAHQPMYATFWSPLLMAGERFCDQHRDKYKLIVFFFNLIHLLNFFNSNPVQHPWKAFHLSEWVDPSKPHCWLGKCLHHVVMVFVVGSSGLWKEFSTPTGTK